jgi:hypothetical protein
MTGEIHPYDPDERDDLAALDFSTVDTPDGTSDLDALDLYAPQFVADQVVEEEEDGVPVPVFTVTNPPGTVTVTVFMDGRVKNIELSPKAVDLTEQDLADEIVVIAGLATQDAKSAQYSFMLEGMRRQGHDDAATRDFLARDLDLPTPEQARAEQARVFATRYSGDHV